MRSKLRPRLHRFALGRPRLRRHHSGNGAVPPPSQIARNAAQSPQSCHRCDGSATASGSTRGGRRRSSSSSRPALLLDTAPLLEEERNLGPLALVANRQTHSFCIGRAPAPLSPPTITQSIPSRSTRRGLRASGSTERNRTAAGACCRCLIRGRPWAGPRRSRPPDVAKAGRELQRV